MNTLTTQILHLIAEANILGYHCGIKDLSIKDHQKQFDELLEKAVQLTKTK